MSLIKVFEEYESYTKSNGIKVTKFKPNSEFEISIMAIDLNTGNVSEKRIIEYSKHENLEMYRVYISSIDHEFWVSEDHSLIVYDIKEDKLVKISPVEILQDKERYYLVQYVENGDNSDKLYIPYTNLTTKILSQGCRFISCDKDVTIEYDPNVTMGYDFTVEDYYTFCTDKGIFVQDTFALFVPFTKEGISQAEKLLNPYHPANPRKLKYEFLKDFKYGTCIMTSDPPSEEYQKKYWWWKDTKIEMGGTKYPTTEGRKFIFDLVPEEYKNVLEPEIFQSKIDIEKLATYLLERNVPADVVKNLLDNVQKKVMNVITVFSKALSIIDLDISSKLEPLVNELDPKDNIDEIQKKLQAINDKLKELLLTDSEDLRFLFNCNVLKFGQLSQLLAVKGLILSPQGEVILVKSNFSKGLDSKEYFEAGHGARMGIVSRAQKTAITGYLQRQMVYASSGVQLDPNIDDCGTGRTVDLVVTKSMTNRIINRYILLDGKLALVTLDLAKQLEGKRIQLRSPIFCISKNICRTCFGEDYKYLNTTQIGFLAAESVGERFTQEIMKAFHTGGTVSFKFIDPIVESVNALGISRDKYDKVLQYKEDTKELIAKEDITFILEKEYYNLNAFIRNVDVGDGLELENIIADITSEKLEETLPYVYDSSVFLHVPNDITLYNKEKYLLKYKKGETLFKVLPVSSDIETKAKRVLAILHGRGSFKDVSHLVTKVYKELEDFGEIILVHIEILLSQILRCPEDPRFPYRLCKDFSKQPVLYGIKKIPYLESWKRGLEFENISNAIANALINDEIVQESLLDDLL